jgi:D-alanyl-D-alanine carboxypeptidase
MVDLSTALTEAAHRLVEDRGTVGLAVAIGPSEGPEAIWMPRALDEEPAFLAYSITKVFTSTLMLLLQQEGRISLDAPVGRWNPSVAEAGRMSLRQLLNHTAGIPDYGGLRSYHEAVRSSAKEPWPPRRFAAETYEKGLLFEPGADWAYSNPGYMLLREIAEEVSGESYATLIAGWIARPLGLQRTFVAERPGDLLSLAAAPSTLLSADGHPVDTREAYHPGWVSHGVVVSTPSEIVHFLRAISGVGLLTPRSLREMTTFVPVPQSFVPEREGPLRWRQPVYGLGLMGDLESPWGVLWGHNGGGPGYHASAFHAPALRGRAVTACAMCAIEDDSIAEALVRSALDVVRQG